MTATVVAPAIAPGAFLEPEDFEPELSPGVPLLEEGVAIAPPNSMVNRDQVFDRATMETIHNKQRLGDFADVPFVATNAAPLPVPAAASSTKPEAEKRAAQLGCAGSHQMPDGSFMPCRTHEEFVAAVSPGLFGFGSAVATDDNTGDGGY
jgi:hypothetical protein